MAPGRLERFSEAILKPEGDVEVSLSFRRGRNRSGLMVGTAKAQVSLECQTCMQPVSLAVEAGFRHHLVEDHDRLQALEEDEDGIVCPSEMVSIADLVEDELLLALPMVARHEKCPVEVQLEEFQADEKDSGETYKPFAGLGELTKDMIDKS